jgi:uncharacterized membrane protein YhhN
MLETLPILLSANDMGVIGLCIFLASSLIFSIPIFATRGKTQLMWFGIVSVVMIAEIALIVTAVVLISTGNWSPSFS